MKPISRKTRQLSVWKWFCIYAGELEKDVTNNIGAERGEIVKLQTKLNTNKNKVVIIGKQEIGSDGISSNSEVQLLHEVSQF